MIETLSDASTYIVDIIKEIHPEDNLDEDTVQNILEDELMEKIAPFLTENDIEELEKNDDDEDYKEGYLQQRVPKYYTVLNDTIQEVIADYLIEKDDED